ncbi:MAG TPA: M17 family peptidase N-terminal domain-containing protein, partial [Candidatus Obscuribacterales bacterium]
MQLMTKKLPLSQVETGLMLVGCFQEGREHGLMAAINTASGGALAHQAEIDGFTGKVGETLVHYPYRLMSAQRVMLYGLGPREKFTVDVLRQALTKAFRAARALKVHELTVAEIPLAGTKVSRYEFGEAVGAYAGMIDYEINSQKTSHRGYKPRPQVEEIRLVTTGRGSKSLATGLMNGRTIANAVNFARDLSNMPAADLTPTVFASHAQAVAERSNGRISLRLIHMDELKAMGLNAVLAVNRGSAEPAVVAVLTYTPPSGATEDVLGLIGKTITFDSGGLNLKPAEGMRWMKRDMSGGAATLAAIEAIAQLGLPISVMALMAATENMPDGRAYKPGDVVHTLAGISVEVDNTDAEGRLTLADMIALAKSMGVKRFITDATLTGAVKQISADVAAGLFSNNERFASLLIKAGKRAGEAYQLIDMHPELRDFNK